DAVLRLRDGVVGVDDADADLGAGVRRGGCGAQGDEAGGGDFGEGSSERGHERRIPPRDGPGKQRAGSLPYPMTPNFLPTIAKASSARSRCLRSCVAM